MTPDVFPGLVGDLTPFLGPRLAAAASLALLIIVCISHGLMPWMPVPSAKGSRFYCRLYNFLRLLAGNYGNATPSGLNQ